ncbi:MmgE/PrpD family protein [Falsiroseomonas tokyonensis]|uniref:MmgE/PrpD family protein n=1 Tax=Falsiroseomonas tokyonensis TaxID=430521 RepID=A0ABV7BX56_9PROT|nr:MmgE/PrpD family protein [Falsiroseomonas tokyonensis]
MPSLTEDLVALLHRPITRADRQRAALHLLDWIGCAVAGAASETGAVFRAHAARQPKGAARIIGGGTASARDATFANGAFGNVLEMDDVHREAILHPGPVIAPTALALATERGADGLALLDAILRGYEAEIRIGRAMGPAHYRQFHPTASCGPFGAVAAAASLLGLDDRATVWALGNAGTQAGGVWQCRSEPVMTKQLHTARAAVMGLEAALLAADGLTGPRGILEGQFGVFAGLAPDARPQRVLAEPDAPWMVHATSFKPWPACRHCHASIDAALELHGIPLAEIATVEVASYGDAIAFCDRVTPESVVQSKFSLQHAVAVALRDGPPPLAAFTPAGYQDAELAALRASVTLRQDEALHAAYPLRYGAAVTVTLANGSRRQAVVPDALGDPENPLPPERILDKARMLMASVGVDAARIEAIIAATLALPDGAPAAALDTLLP